MFEFVAFSNNDQGRESRQYLRPMQTELEAMAYMNFPKLSQTSASHRNPEGAVSLGVDLELCFHHAMKGNILVKCSQGVCSSGRSSCTLVALT